MNEASLDCTQFSSEGFRAIKVSDLDLIVAIENECHIHPWSKGVFKDCLRVSYTCEMLMDDQADSVIVYGVMSVAAGEAHIFNVCVNVKYRRQGFGKKMITHMLEVARNKSAGEAFLEVRPSNKFAIALYEQMGFEITGRRKDYYPSDNGREDAVIMSVKLIE